MNHFQWISPKSVPEAANAADATVADLMTLPREMMVRAGGAIVKAGGIDLLDLMKSNLLAPARVVNVRDIADLDAIGTDAGGSLRIGATATLASIATDALVRRLYPALSDVAANTASPQIRNVATVAGNLLQRPRCWYFRSAEFRCLRKGGGHCFAIGGESQYHAVFDNKSCAIVHPSSLAPVLVALGAELEIANPEGTSRRVDLERIFTPASRDLQHEHELKPHEIVSAVILPAPAAGSACAWIAQSEKAFDWPLAAVAVALERSGNGTCRRASIILGAAAPTPYRATSSERALEGRAIDMQLAREAGHAAIAGATPLAKTAYKLPIIETLVRRAILKAAGIE
jgi:xanthine dehydrogenase YagS FAD-binding subunit